MSLTAEDRKRLQELIDAIRDGRTLEDHESQWLRSILLNEDEARDTYAEALWYAGAIGWLLKGAATAQAAAARLEEPPSRYTSAIYSFRRGVASVQRHFAWSVFAMAAGFSGYVAFLGWNLYGARQPHERSHSYGDIVASITTSAGATWNQPPRHVPTGMPEAREASRPVIAQGETLGLASGSVELQLNRGVDILVRGPAEWSIEGDNTARLLRGTLRAKVPPGAIGFTVDTPTAQIVDLGTEFTVTVDARGKSDVRVLSGVIDVRQSKEVRNRFNESFPTQRLTVGQQASVDYGGMLVDGRPVAEAASGKR